ncbi:ankyrin repeat domain-containing protein [bacterium]|jgi:hypothetical protein|nr:ankyrin repeat domain-containing protein [bacterium]MBT5015540.1 ankyrin repeat domain-containing protein [bacterium]
MKLGRSILAITALMIATPVLSNMTNSPLIKAAAKQNWDEVKRLVCPPELIFALNSPDTYGMTVLMYAAARADLDTVRWLVDHGAKVDGTKSRLDWTVLMYAIYVGKTTGSYEIARYLIQEAPDLMEHTTKVLYPEQVMQQLSEGKKISDALANSQVPTTSLDAFAKQHGAPASLVKLIQSR